MIKFSNCQNKEKTVIYNSFFFKAVLHSAMTQETAVIHAASTDDERDDLRIVDGGDVETGSDFLGVVKEIWYFWNSLQFSWWDWGY